MCNEPRRGIRALYNLKIAGHAVGDCGMQPSLSCVFGPALQAGTDLGEDVVGPAHTVAVGIGE